MRHLGDGSGLFHRGDGGGGGGAGMGDDSGGGEASEEEVRAPGDRHEIEIVWINEILVQN